MLLVHFHMARVLVRCSGVFPSVSCILVLDVKHCVLVCSNPSHLLILEFKVLQVFGLALFFTHCGPFHARKE